jgi:hypothetical protein
MPSAYKIMTELEVTPEQLPSVRQVLTEAEDEREAILSQAGRGGDPDSMMALRERLDAVNERAEEKLAAVLTTEQMSEYRSLIETAVRERELMRSQGGGRRGGGTGGRKRGL